MSITVTTEKQFESDIEAFFISVEGGYYFQFPTAITKAPEWEIPIPQTDS